jgi:hypothetical protein
MLSFCASFECPAVEDLKDCLCYQNSQTLRCIDHKKELPDLTDQMYLFKTITIQDFASIEINAIRNAQFEKLTIERNENLTNVSSALWATHTKTLVIRDNPKLNGTYLIENIGKASDLEMIELKSIKIMSIKKEAFSGLTKLKQIFLQHNLISVVHSHAFKGLTQLEEINLEYNKIVKLDADSFAIESNSYVVINLNHNKLKSEDLNNSFSSKSGIQIFLEDNELNSITESILDEILSNERNILFLNNNPIMCLCSNKEWSMKKIHLSRQLINLKCANKNSTDIFRLGYYDLCDHTTTSQTEVTKVTVVKTTKSSIEPPTEKPLRTLTPKSTTTLSTSAPSAPTENNTRSEPTAQTLHVTTTAPSAPTENNTRSEPTAQTLHVTTTVPSAPAENNIRSEPTT